MNNKMKPQDIKIDFVIPWVDGNNPEWRARYNKYREGDHPEDVARYRDWDLLRYWFRAVEKYAPWVNKIYFITSGELPEWINLDGTNNLVHVKHEDFIPEKYLPTFSSQTIELNLHRIKGLSEHFVYFNDDMFLNGPIKPTYFFREGLPCDAPCESLFSSAYYNKRDGWGVSIQDYCNVGVLNFHFNRYKTIKASPYRWFGPYLGFWNILSAILISRFQRFQRFRMRHQAIPYLKSTFIDAWDKEYVYLNRTCVCKFRNETSLNQWFIRYWQLAKNMFYPCCHNKTGKYISATDELSLKLVKTTLNNEKIKCVCLNDTPLLSDDGFIRIQPQIKTIFDNKLDFKSKYEK